MDQISNRLPIAATPGRVFVSLAATLLLSSNALAQPTSRKPPRDETVYRQRVLEIQEYLQQSDFPAARTLLDKAEKQFPQDGGLENLVGIIEIQQGHPDLAARQFSLAIQHSRRLAGAYLNLGRVYMQTAATDSKALDLAFHVYEKLLVFDPTNSEGNFEIATLLFGKQNYQASLDHLNKLPQSDREQAGSEALYCADYAALHHTSEADAEAKKLSANPDLTEQDAASTLPALRVARRADLIETIYTAANQQHPLSTDGLRTLGLAQEANGKLPEARSTLEKVFASKSASTLVLVDLARIARAQQDYQAALGYIAHARDLDPKDASLAYEFGIICLRMSLLGESRKAMEEAVKLSPDSFEYNLGMGTVSSFAQDPTIALPYLEKAHTLRPNVPAPILALGATYFRAKNFEAAIPWFTKATTLAATAAEAHYYLGRIARQQSRFEDASKELEQSNTLTPDRPDTVAELGELNVTRRRYPDAQRYLDHALQLDSNNYLANFALLQLYARTNDPRREEQSKRFDEIKEKDEAQFKEMMRVIDIRHEP